KAKADTKDMAEVANRLFEKISNTVGKVDVPVHNVRMAKAATKALSIKAEREATLPAIQDRAVERFIQQETRKQENLESIIGKAREFLSPVSEPEQLNEDWLHDWSERASKVSDEELQSLWARLLANETNTPGSFRKGVLHTVALLEKADADNFTKLCQFVVHAGGPVPLVFDIQQKIYKDAGLSFTVLGDLEALGLVFHNSTDKFFKRGFPKRFDIQYGPLSLQVELPKRKNELVMGQVRFTKVGEQLFPLSGAELMPTFPQHIADEYRKTNITVTGPAIR
ncbi:MAG: DUF2806 domain-containing protein, partial [Methyloligellaceae bacterium]